MKPAKRLWMSVGTVMLLIRQHRPRTFVLVAYDPLDELDDCAFDADELLACLEMEGGDPREPLMLGTGPGMRQALARTWLWDVGVKELVVFVAS